MNKHDPADVGRWVKRVFQELKHIHINDLPQVEQRVKNIANEFKDYQKNTSTSNEKQEKKTVYTVEVKSDTQQALPGKVSGVLFTVFGWIGVSISTIVWLSLMTASIVKKAPDLFLGASVITLPLIFVFIVLILNGSTLLNRIKRFKRYQTFLGESDFCSVQQIAAFIGQTPQFVSRDLKKMIQVGMFEEAFLDEKRTYLILGKETYQQYLNLQRKAEMESKNAVSQEPTDSIIAEGKDYIKRIRQVNDEIPGEDISNKLYRLEEITTNIFDYVEQHPEKKADIRTFMRYYLPTTLKLVHAYRDFSEHALQGKDVLYAQSEIQHILETINIAFENLLKSLYQDNILDITADIATLEKVLAQDGLTGNGFEMPKDEKTPPIV